MIWQMAVLYSKHQAGEEKKFDFFKIYQTHYCTVQYPTGTVLLYLV